MHQRLAMHLDDRLLDIGLHVAEEARQYVVAQHVASRRRGFRP
jgi:hypothetical protein